MNILAAWTENKAAYVSGQPYSLSVAYFSTQKLKNLRGEEGLQEHLRGSNGLLGPGGVLGLETLLLEDLLPAEGLGVGVETEENSPVDEGVLLLCPGPLLDLLASRADDGLDLVTVDEAGDIGVGDLGCGEEVILLEGGGFVEGPENFVKKSKSGLSPDNETADMSSGGELEEVQSPDIDELNTGQVAEGLDDAVVLVVNNKGATALTMPAVPELSLSGTELAGVGDLDNIGIGIEGLEEGNSLLGLGEGLGSSVDDEGNLLDLLDAVTAGENKGREG